MNEKVRQYYGQTLQHSDVLQTGACCGQAMPFDGQATQGRDSAGDWC